MTVTKRVLAILCAVLMLVSLAACGDKEEEKKLEGDYTFVEAEGSGAEIYNSLKEDIALTIDSSDVGTMTVSDYYSTELKFNTDTGKVTIEGVSVPYTFDGKTLTIEDSGGKMVFKKK